jgi:NAD(P)-dependent dehydrogenase (short-subunit alcohol dehydrogenase family)
MNTETWISENIPDQTGKIFVVTGANSGIGFEISKILAGKNARVVMIGRNSEKLKAAADEIGSENLRTEVIDLADLDQVRTGAEKIRNTLDQIDGLINNAGIMMPSYTKTEQGFELQLGVNHLAHFLLTKLLLPGIKSVDGRVVSLSSMAAMNGEIKFDDINFENGYGSFAAYAQSKLANLLFSVELNRRLELDESTGATAYTAHPGTSATNIFRPFNSDFLAGIVKNILKLFSMSPKKGALGAVYAATSPTVVPGEFYGPKSKEGKPGMRGFPERIGINSELVDQKTAKKLWELSEEMIGEKFEVN